MTRNNCRLNRDLFKTNTVDKLENTLTSPWERPRICKSISAKRLNINKGKMMYEVSVSGPDSIHHRHRRRVEMTWSSACDAGAIQKRKGNVVRRLFPQGRVLLYDVCIYCILPYIFWDIPYELKMYCLDVYKSIRLFLILCKVITGELINSW